MPTYSVLQKAKIPIDLLETPTLKSKNSHSFPIDTNSNALKFSFLPNTVVDWNSVPERIISSMKSAADPVKLSAATVRGGAA